MVVCRACGQENPEGARFCLACATSLQPEVPERRKLATVVFCDVTGSTALGERVDPESVREIMAAYFREMRTAVERHGGVVEKFIGDAVVAVFGVPIGHEDDAVRGVRAAWEMRLRLGPLNEELQTRYGSAISLRIGVNTGEVVAGDASARQAIVTGDAVNVAARLEQAATPGEILLGETTARLVRDVATTAEVEPLVVKGKSEPLRAYRLSDVADAAAVRSHRLDTPMVGREAELELLREHLADARQGRPVLLTVVGEPGVGKSRLAAELLGAVRGDFRILSGRCLQYGDGITYWPIGEIVRDAAGIHDEHSRAEARTRIELLSPGGDAAIVAQAIGIADGEAGTDEIAGAFAGFVRALTAERPVLLFIDDIQSGEAALLDLVAGLPAALESAPAAIVCLSRPELLAQRPEWVATVRLEPLAEGDATALVAGLLGEGLLAPDVLARIAAVAAGNPLFVEELVGMMLDDALIQRRDGRWVATGELDKIAIPATLRELLGARLDRLPRDDRAALERGAVEGQVFHGGAVAELSEDAQRDEVPARLRSLEERELVRSVPASFAGETAYRVRHVLIRDAAYEAMPKRLRSTLHERFAAWLTAKSSDRPAEYDEIVGYHLEQSFRYHEELGPVSATERELAMRAAERLTAAGRRAFARRDAGATVKLFSRSAALLPRHDPTRLELLRATSHMLIDANELARARATLDELVEDATASGQSGPAAHARLYQSFVRFMTDPAYGADGVRDEADQVAPMFEELDDEVGRARVHDGRAFGFDQRRQMTDAEREADLAIECARRVGDRHLECEMHWWLFWALSRGPRPVGEAIERCHALRKAVDGDPAADGMALGVMAELEAMGGRLQEARRLSDASAALMIELGLWVFERRAALVRGWIDLLAGDPVAAEQRFRRVYEEIRPVGELETLSHSASLLAEALCDQGRLDEAAQLVDDASTFTPRDAVAAEARWLCVRARTLTRSGSGGGGDALVRQAIDLTQATDDLNLRAYVRAALGDLLDLSAAHAAARDAYVEALELYDRKGNVVSAEKVRDAIARLDHAASARPSIDSPA